MEGQRRAPTDPGLSLHGHTVHQEEVSLFTLVSQDIHFFERPGHLPNFENEMSVANSICCLEAALPSQTPPWKPESARSLRWVEILPAEQDTAAKQPPAWIREPVSLFKRMNKTFGQDTFCCVPRCRQGQGKIGQLRENIASK